MLTLQFIPYHEIEHLDSDKRITKILNYTRENKIVLIEGKIAKDEETKLISKTMEQIDDDFKGIELAVIHPDSKSLTLMSKLKSSLLDILMRDRQGFTIVGPATIVKEIKRDPGKIQLLTESSNNKQSVKRKRIKRSLK